MSRGSGGRGFALTGALEKFKQKLASGSFSSQRLKFLKDSHNKSGTLNSLTCQGRNGSNHHLTFQTKPAEVHHRLNEQKGAPMPLSYIDLVPWFSDDKFI